MLIMVAICKAIDSVLGTCVVCCIHLMDQKDREYLQSLEPRPKSSLMHPPCENPGVTPVFHLWFSILTLHMHTHTHTHREENLVTLFMTSWMHFFYDHLAFSFPYGAGEAIVKVRIVSTCLCLSIL